MITEQQYQEATRVVSQYLRQENKPIWKHAKLLGVHDTHHPYDYLKIGVVYEIKKWYPPQYRRSGRMARPEAFSIAAGGKVRKYNTDTQMLTWGFS